MTRTQWWSSAVIVMAAAVTTVGCSPPAQRSMIEDGILYCAEGNPESFNPQLVTSATTLDMIAGTLYDRLIDYNDEAQTYVPALAKAWSVSDSGSEYHFTLRQGVQFHETDYFSPTRTLNAEDVLFTFQRWLDPAHPYHDMTMAGYPLFDALQLASLIKDIEAISEYEVRIRLHEPDSSLLATLATDFAAILSAEYANTLLQANRASDLDTYPIGSGPFRYQSFRKDVSLSYQRHPQYWQGPALSQRIVYRIIPSDHKRMLMLLTGDCDMIPYPPARDIQDIEHRADLQLTSTVSPNTSFWAFNTQQPPFDDVRVRQALAHAVNRQAIIDAVYYGHAELAQSILPSMSWAHDPDAQAYAYDPQAARQLLADAGLADGFDMTIWATPVQRAYNPNARKMAELIQADLANIGVRATIVSYEWSAFRRRLADGEHDSVLIGWSGDSPDPDNFFRPLLSCAAVSSGNNRARWCEPHFDELVSQAIRVSDNAQRRHFYHQAQQLLNDQVPLLPIAHSKRYHASQPDIAGFKLQSYGGMTLHQAHKRMNEDTPQAQP